MDSGSVDEPRNRKSQGNSGQHRIEFELPVIVTEHGVLVPLVDYLLEKAHARSYSWMQKVVQSVSLLLDYLRANQNCFNDPSPCLLPSPSVSIVAPLVLTDWTRATFTGFPKMLRMRGSSCFC